MRKIQLLLICMVFYNTYGINKALDLTASSLMYAKTSAAPLTGNAKYTVEAWFNTASLNSPSYARIVGFDGFPCEIAILSSKVVFYDGAWRTTTSPTLSSGWHHVAVTNDNSNIYVYLDGSQIYTKVSGTYNFTSKLMYVGVANTVDVASNFKGYIDEVRVWNVSKTLNQINTDKTKQMMGNESGLMVYYRFDDLKDRTSNANNLTFTGTAVYKKFKFGDYLLDFSLSFDEYDDKLELVGSNISGTSNFTVEMQFKTTAAPSIAYRRLFSRNGFYVAMPSGGKISHYFNGWSSTNANALNDGTWHHLAIVRSNNNLYVYIDGAIIGSRIIPSTTSFNLNTYFGGLDSPNGITESFNGELDEIKIWSVAKNQSQISSMMDSVLVGNESNLLSYFDCNTPADGSSSVINLVSGANNCTRIGSSGNNNLPQYIGYNTDKTFKPAIISSTGATICPNLRTTISAVTTKGTINWYDQATGGNLLYTGLSFNTPALTDTTKFYAEATQNGNSSTFRIPVTVNVKKGPKTSVVVNPNVICRGGYSVLSPSGADAYTWTPNTAITLSIPIVARPIVTTTYSANGVNLSTGCTDTFRFTITVLPASNVLISKNGNTLSVAQDSATYQWIDCKSNQNILGATQQSYTPSVSGDYKVIVTKNGCNDTSVCESITITNVQAVFNQLSSINVYPIPANEELIVVSNSVANAKVFNSNGQLIYETVLKIGNTSIETNQLSSGFYTIVLTLDGQTQTRKIIIE